MTLRFLDLLCAETLPERKSSYSLNWIEKALFNLCQQSKTDFAASVCFGTSCWLQSGHVLGCLFFSAAHTTELVVTEKVSVQTRAKLIIQS